ncbi:heat shock 70 kDa protein 12A-like [Mytilus edulis]|uniref:heat shock 70 kDa protein 12A-like n=1 Tax=Mytilus edulis TaxID=6550 RepID=UPI0039EEB1E1
MTQANFVPQCVVALDIGSDGCGYAFSMDYQFKTDLCDIQIPIWSPSTGSMTSLKAPSAILFDSDKKFKAVGFDPQDKIDEILNSGDQNNWYYVECFKMALYNAVEKGEDIRKDFLIREKEGKEISAKFLFSSSIKFLKDHFLKAVFDRQISFQEDKIKWISTVPAIWTDSCKQFMRESATELESVVPKEVEIDIPEINFIVDKCEIEQRRIILKTFQPGTKLLVVGAGGK